MSQKQNGKGFYIFAIGSTFMASLAVVIASALTGGWNIAMYGLTAIVLLSALIYFFPRVKLR